MKSSKAYRSAIVLMAKTGAIRELAPHPANGREWVGSSQDASPIAMC